MYIHPFLCPGIDVNHCKKTGDFLRDPDNCGIYWVCEHIGTEWAKISKKKCPKGLHWNTKLLICDWPQNANCGQA